MTQPKQVTENKTSLWQQILLITLGTVFAITLVLLVLYLFPSLLGTNNPLARQEAGKTLDVEFWLTDGDYFVHQQGRIRPPEEDILLDSYTITWDEDGFRVPAMQAESYPIAAFGDSFTEGTTVAEPWVDLLARELDTPVENFAYRGFGPKEIAYTAENYLGDGPRSWVLYMHFSGNDLSNANRPLDTQLTNREPISQLAFLARQAISGSRTQVVENPTGQYDYPMPLIIGGSYYEIALLEDLLWWQVAPEGGFLGTSTFNVVGDAMTTLETLSSENACRAIIFAPSKEQIYYPYIHEDVRQWIRGIARQTVLTNSGAVILEDMPLSAEDEADFIASLGDQRDALQALAEEQGWLFIDLLEPFQQSALERGIAGESLLYYQYDGHWSPAGHNLATQVISDFMRDHAEDCPLEVN